MSARPWFLDGSFMDTAPHAPQHPIPACELTIILLEMILEMKPRRCAHKHHCFMACMVDTMLTKSVLPFWRVVMIPVRLIYGCRTARVTAGGAAQCEYLTHEEFKSFLLLLTLSSFSDNTFGGQHTCAIARTATRAERHPDNPGKHAREPQMNKDEAPKTPNHDYRRGAPTATTKLAIAYPQCVRNAGTRSGRGRTRAHREAR